MLPPILQRVKDLGHVVFTNGDWNLNIVGIRAKEPRANKFDDMITCTYRDDGQWVTRCWKATCDPGQYWLGHPMRVSGTAILVPGQYRGVYKISKHRGAYDALCQRNGRVKVYRDGNKDDILDMDDETVIDGYFGINIHRSSSSRESTQVDKWSAGCQVFADPKAFDGSPNSLMELCRKQTSERGWKTFTYTLIED